MPEEHIAVGVGTEADTEPAEEVVEHCGAPKHVSLAPDSISNRLTSKQKGVTDSG
jgi:hypothetical protein